MVFGLHSISLHAFFQRDRIQIEAKKLAAGLVNYPECCLFPRWLISGVLLLVLCKKVTYAQMGQKISIFES